MCYLYKMDGKNFVPYVGMEYYSYYFDWIIWKVEGITEKEVRVVRVDKITLFGAKIIPLELFNIKMTEDFRINNKDVDKYLKS